MSRDREAILRCRGLSVGYGGKPVLPKIDFSLSAGEIMALVGPNGTGKSTILNTVSGELPPLGGELVLDGRDIRACSARELAELAAVVLPAVPRAAYMTCREVVEAGRYPHTSRLGRLGEGDRAAVERSISAVEAQDYADRPFEAVSDGQRQRILIARALSQEPRLLIMDEPTAWLDLRYRRLLAELLRGLAASGTAVLLSLHETELAAELASVLLCVRREGCRTEVPARLREEAFLRELFGLGDRSPQVPGEKPADLERAHPRQIPVGRPGDGPPESAPGGVLMVQGSMSGVGKSLIVAGLCRLLRQDGIRVAPFKAQNMALNSYVTEDGLEIGRAQALQAEAAQIPADVRMNPILLKPTGERRSQVIVNGRVWRDMDAMAYYARKSELFPEVLRAFRELRASHDVVLIEGAGSPAEINLRDHDIVNMGLATTIGAPVLLVGDIDRGGVFAQLVGTLALLREEERGLVQGLLINRFRGDEALLAPGLLELEERTGIPVWGTIPYLRHNLEEEDSLAELLELGGPPAAGALDVAAIRFPRISNFTDLQILREAEGVCLRFVGAGDRLGRPDLLILPGSKDTLADLSWLRETGLFAEIRRAAAEGSVLLGICGGYQMLGTTLSDQGTEAEGLGLLPARTVFYPEKRRRRMAGRLRDREELPASLRGLAVRGYEIHTGRTEALPGAEAHPLLCLRDEETGEAMAEGLLCGNVAGTYLHGILDTGATTAALLSLLARRRGLSWQHPAPLSRRESRERDLDLLADALRRHLDRRALYRALGLGEPKNG